MSNRQLFFNHLGQTSQAPMGIEMLKAKGIYLYDINNKKYIDAISGFSVANIGHSNNEIITAIQQQAEQYMHLIVYGEFIQQPQVAYAKLLVDNLPKILNCVYFTNSGAEATEGAMKLAKRVTNRSKIIAFNHSYHGSTQGALSVMGSEYWRNAYRPLLPNVYHFNFNNENAINAIDENTACVILEIVQAEAGIIQPDSNWIKQIRKKCNENNVLLIADEIQSGFGRTGTLFAFEQFNIIPDILLLGKALGGGMPLGAFIADKKLMNALTNNPVLGHITTFGGHPVSCAAGKAAMEFLLKENLIHSIKEKEKILKQTLQHQKIKIVRTCGLWAAVEFDSFEINHAIIQKCIANGVITDWFLFADNCLRIAPPLIITTEELVMLCNIVKQSIDDVFK
ncbi:MAG: aspartate aminotransferase family protein [Bacteroidetes bacterium]|nr:aspartate aminotransferase family protein [Bacteroidota bacterium]MBS1649367.1 aspartate aminotransferase family protein [Bacteroidota bacterium]